LLSIAPVHARFDLSEEDATVARDWLDAAAVRWGEDGAFRARFHNPTLPQHTWRWGLDRLLLGYAIEGEGSRLYADILPIDGIEGNNALPLGGLCGYCAALFEHLARLEGEYTPTDWVAVLLGAYDALVSTRGTWASSRLTLVRALGELSGDKPVAIGAVADWLDGHLEQVAREEHFYTGGVTCASLRAGRVVPVRVVALLGLDYDRFPRDPTPLAFDLCAADPHPGDLPVRSEDRLVFRSAVLAAADHLHLSYTGHGSRDNKERPPSVLISELLDSLSPSVRLATTVFHPMQPFSPRAFEDARTPNYSISLHGGAVALLADTQKEPPFFPVPLAADPASLVVDLNVLIRFFQNPVATVLKRRLELTFEQDADPPSDTEPFSLSSLEDWKVGDKLVRAMLVGADAEQLWPAMRESGLLPMGTPGRIKYEGLAETASVIVAAALACGAGDARPNVDLDIVLPALSGGPVPGRVTGRLDGRRLGGGLSVTYSKLDAKRLLAAWIRHLAAQSAGVQPDRAWAVGRDKPGKPDIRAWQATPDPTRWLHQLMMLHAEGMTRPLPFMPKSSFAYAVKYLALRGKGTAEPERRREAGNAAYGAWLPSSMGIGKEIPGEGDDPAVARVYDSSVLWTDEFHTLALRVFAPMQGEYSLPESSL
jgi:exodeoxyribonuclease V gamma subunit